VKLERIDSVLVANRGEIAVRVIRTAAELGLRTIAVYSELDRDALHVHLADEAWNIGPAPAAESYLNMQRVLEVASEAKAAAIHPGYGFLSENADFAQAVMDAGIAWVGPPPQAIRVMGDKISSRRAAIDAGAPTVPGTTEPAESADEVKATAEEYGYPVAIKAAHGGGGKGLRVVWSAEEIDSAYDGARREADAYFGNPAVYVEKYIEKPRHVEAQILVDDHGNELFLGERDCSVQRRHQKLIEETPSDAMNKRQRKALGEAALSIGRICGYRNAGTVEFLLDRDGDFYFLEMNTRLQVEHCITEMVTGIDLVAEQLLIADGQPVSDQVDQPDGPRHRDADQRRGPVRQLHARARHDHRISRAGRIRSAGRRVGTTGDHRQPVLRQSHGQADRLGARQNPAIARARRALTEYDVHGVATTIPAHQAGSRPSRLRRGPPPHPLGRRGSRSRVSRSATRRDAAVGRGSGPPFDDRRDRGPALQRRLLGDRAVVSAHRRDAPERPTRQKAAAAAGSVTASTPHRCRARSSRCPSKRATAYRPVPPSVCSRR
jgi:biotin carboxylase